MTIAATIQAAEIQAAATYRSTITAALIGAAGIAIGVAVSWYTALHLQKVARLAETRRDVYLEFCDSFANMTSEMTFVFANINNNWTSFTDSVLEFKSKIDKVSFVCETHNKESLYIFFSMASDKCSDFFKAIDPLKALAKKHSKLKEEFHTLDKQLEEIAEKIKKNEFGEPNKRGEQALVDYFNELREKLRSKGAEITIIIDELSDLKDDIKPCLKEILNDLNEGFIPLSHKLRAELGAKTDIKLDFEIYSKFSNI